jgi:hypothetical protein
MPRNFDGRLETSVFRVRDLSGAQIWSLGRRWVKYFSTNSLKGRADFIAKSVQEIESMSINPSPSPHPRHADILGWSSDEATQLSVALELALGSKLEVPSQEEA